MKRIYSIFSAAVCTLCLVTSCLKETIPTTIVTEEQKDQAYNVESMLLAMPARLHAMASGNDHYAFGYGAMMHIRDVQTGDLAVDFSNYDQFIPWERNVNMGANSKFMQYIWNYYYQSIRTCNIVLATVPADTLTSDIERGARGAAYAFRALFYLDLARAYEFLANDIYPDSVNAEGNNIAWLTVPIADEFTTEAGARNTPRATRQQMFTFIESDLLKADSLIHYIDDDPTYAYDRTLPHSYSVKGLLARLYMWVEDYDKAYSAAVDAQNECDKAQIPYMIESGTVFSMSDGMNPPFTGFNTPSSFMWCDTQTSDNATVQSGICNWVSWMCPITSYGYAGNGAISCIDMNLYNSINPNDYRKGFYVVGNAYYPDGMSVKFAPGGMDYNIPLVSAASSYPIMRREEMAFIEIEAAAHLDPSAGCAALESFMNSYCMMSGTYKYSGKLAKADIIDEILTQKRIELWGEGQSFFDIKRLDKSVTRGYEGTNFSDLTRFNTNGRPAWMNWVIVLTEENGNDAVRGMNNPDPSDKYKLWSDNQQ